MRQKPDENQPLELKVCSTNRGAIHVNLEMDGIHYAIPTKTFYHILIENGARITIDREHKTKAYNMVRGGHVDDFRVETGLRNLGGPYERFYQKEG